MAHKHRNPPSEASSTWLIWAGLLVLGFAFGLRYLMFQFGGKQGNEDAAAMIIATAIVIAGLCWIGAYGRKH